MPHSKKLHLNSNNKSSKFDEIIESVNPSFVPNEYILGIIVYYRDGRIVKLDGDDVRNPLPVNKEATWHSVEDRFKSIKDIHVLIDTDLVERDVTDYMSKFYESHGLTF